MSTPPFLDLPACARRVEFVGRVGPLAGFEALPARSTPILGTILLVPGFTGSKEDFIAVLEPLSLRGWRVVTYDQRGQYESPGLDEHSAYTLAEFASDLHALLAVLPDPLHLVGHSFGGLVARHAALEGADVASLTLLCSGPGPIPARQHGALRFVHDALPAMSLGDLYDLSSQHAATPPPSGNIGEFLRERYCRNNPWAIGQMALDLIDVPDRTDELAKLAAAGTPIHVAYGPDDDAWPTAQQDAVAAACATTATVIPDTGHSPCAEDPLAAAHALDMLLRGQSSNGPASPVAGTS